MFDLIYQAMFGLMLIEMVLFLFLNLPFPKTWKAGFFENLASSNFFKTAFKIQIVLCLIVVFLFLDLSRTESLYMKDKRKIKDQTTMGAGTPSITKKSRRSVYRTRSSKSRGTSMWCSW